MNIHIIGICGTFMGGVARLAIELGHHVSGSDQNTYPPMSTQLESIGVNLIEGYAADNIPINCDIVIVGNTISRNNPELEQVLSSNQRYTSGAQWLSENVLRDKWVLAVSGTHGKTTTSSMLSWILDYCGFKPGFLIGGVPENFSISARLGESDFFVIEADEYDTAFCDKRSKFIHYHPKTLVINNLEFDHADIFANLDAIQQQFHHLVKIVPKQGQIINNIEEASSNHVFSLGCWSERKTFAIINHEKESKSLPDWSICSSNKDGSTFKVEHNKNVYKGTWDLIGEHNLNNAISAIAAAHHVGIPIDQSCAALQRFKSVKRRMELKAIVADIAIYDDFAHHPTAIKKTVSGLRNHVDKERIIAIIEPRSNTMKMGIHQDTLAAASSAADYTCYFIDDQVQWKTDSLNSKKSKTFNDIDQLIQFLSDFSKSNDHLLFMSNGGFHDVQNKIKDALQEKISL